MNRFLRIMFAGLVAAGLIFAIRVSNAQISVDSTSYLPVIGGPGGTEPPITPTPTSSPSATALPTSCPAKENLLINGGFEDGQSPWVMYSNGSAGLVFDEDAQECSYAARLLIEDSGNNTQLYQTGFLLRPATRYKLAFSAYSSTGDNLEVVIQRHGAPYQSYGLSQEFDLDTNWQTFSAEFDSVGVNSASMDTRIRFWFPGYAGDNVDYWIDDVRLVEVGGAMTPMPSKTKTPGPSPTSSSTGTPPAPTQVPPTTAPPLTSTPGNGGGQEMLIFDLNRRVTKSDRGFPNDQPPMKNFDWTSPINYAAGTLHYRVEIRSQPEPKNMRLQFCFWQEKNGYNFALEACGPMKSITGTPGTVATWSVPVDKMWYKDGKRIEWWRPRYRNGIAIKNSSGLPVSDYSGWNWNGENPDQWYPLDMRFRVMIVAPGVEFSGWENYLDE